LEGKLDPKLREELKEIFKKATKVTTKAEAIEWRSELVSKCKDAYELGRMIRGDRELFKLAQKASNLLIEFLP